MIAVLQRVNKASVEVGGEKVSEINKGILVFLGIDKKDTEQDAEYLAEKIVNLRIFEDNNSKMNLSVKDIKGEIMVVSEFTLIGDCKRGNRPCFDKAMRPNEAESLYRYFIEILKTKGVPVKEGIFRSFMRVSLINEGPVTFILESVR